jgi:aquaporin Z
MLPGGEPFNISSTAGRVARPGGSAFVFMTVVLVAINAPRLERFVGVMVAALILVEAPLSGMSINPARTQGSAVPARIWTGLCVYFTAPLAGMLLAAEAFLRLSGRRSVRTAKLCHDDSKRCIFRCDHHSAAPHGA